MAPPENSPEILSLSSDAQALLAGHWGLGVNASLTLQNQRSRLSERGAAAMAELVKAGIISDEKADDGYAESRTYRLTPHGATLEFRKSLPWMEQNAKFKLTTLIDEATPEP